MRSAGPILRSNTGHLSETDGLAEVVPVTSSGLS